MSRSKRGVASSERHATACDRRWSARGQTPRPGVCCQSCAHFVRVLMPSPRWHEARDAERTRIPRRLPVRGRSPDEETLDQCGGCRYYVVLEGVYTDDWGACACPRGRWDGQIVFEHDACERFEASQQGWGGATPRAALLPFEPVCEEGPASSAKKSK